MLKTAKGMPNKIEENSCFFLEIISSECEVVIVLLWIGKQAGII